MERKRLNRKQVVVTLVMLAIVWMPVSIFVIFYSQSYSPRQIAVVGAINLAIIVPLIIYIGRRWISKLK